MKTVGSYEAKTHLSSLISEVEKGEQFLITRHGRVVARLCPVSPREPERVSKAIKDLKEFQKKHRLDGLSVRDMIEEGRPL